MEILGSLGQMYMFVLLVLLFVGAGLAAWAFINNLTSKNSPAKPGAQDKAKPPAVSEAPNNNIINSKPEADKKSGGFKITDSKWYKLALYSLIGILLSVTLLGFAATNSSNESAHNHSNSQSAMNSPQMGSMPANNMQGVMNGNMTMYSMPVNNAMPNNYMMMQQLYMMQQQLNRMQQQMMNMQQNGGMGGM